MTFENSPKVKALQIAGGKPWRLIAREWKAAARSQREIAAAWTGMVQPFAPQVRFSQRDVSRIFEVAEKRPHSTESA